MGLFVYLIILQLDYFYKSTHLFKRQSRYYRVYNFSLRLPIRLLKVKKLNSMFQKEEKITL